MPKRASGKGVQVDFTGVESGGGRAVADGEYLAEVRSVSEEESSEGNPYLKWVWKVIEDGEAKGATLYDNTSLQPQALWRLKTLLEVIGFDIPERAMTLDLKGLVGKKAKLEVTNEDYKGKQRPRVTGFSMIAVGSAKAAPKKKDEDDESSSFKVGQKVKFKDEDGKVYKGRVADSEGDTVTVDVDGEEWEVEAENVTAL